MCELARSVGARGSFSLLSHRSPRFVSRSVLDDCKRVRVALGEPWFYLRLGQVAGLSLIRVLREGLWLDECLGVTVSRANDLLETAPRTLVPDPGAVAEGNAPTAASWIRALARLHRQLR